MLVQGVDGWNGGKHDDGNRAENAESNQNNYRRRAICEGLIQQHTSSIDGRKTGCVSVCFAAL